MESSKTFQNYLDPSRKRESVLDLVRMCLVLLRLLRRARLGREHALVNHDPPTGKLEKNLEHSR